MKLPFSFLQKNDTPESEYYLALLITDEKASAVILKEDVGKLRILSKHEEFFTTSLEHAELEEIISLVDKTISRAEEVLPPNVETHKTVFGVKESWVEPETKRITKENLAKLKKVCDALDLTPIGFMVVTEAISHLLQEEEGAPLSAILAEIGRKTVILTLLRGGKAVERIDGPLAQSAPATVDTLLKHFTTAVLPARLILYDAKEAEKLSQQFIGHPWSNSLPFLHVPQITALPSGFDAKAVAFGAGEQMGFELIGFDLKDLKKEIITQPTEETEEAGEKKVTEKAEEDSTEEAVATPLSGDNFGFVTDQDITKVKGEEPYQSTITHPSSPSYQVNERQNDAYEREEYGEESKPRTAARNPFGFLSGIRLPQFSMGGLTGRKRLVLPLGVLFGFILLVGALMFYYYHNVKAHIILSVSPKMVDQEADVLFSSTDSSNFSDNIIAAKPLTSSVDGSLTIDTTGKKDVGNKAKGTVTIYNNDDSSIKLPSGTQIKASNGVIFVTDKEVTIASASGDIFSGTKPGTTDAAVTAKDIGSESNLPSGTKFGIGSNSSLAAKNDSAFSGGSKKQVQVVSKNDVAKLRAELPKTLTEKAKDAISQKADGDVTIIPLISVVSLNKASFDNDVDDEAKKVKLTATVVFQALAYNNDEIVDYTKTLLKDKYSQDISEESIKSAVRDAKEKSDSEVEATLAIQAGLLPDIDTKDVVSKVETMSLGEARELMAGLPQVADSKISFSPAIPLIPQLFPRLPKQVSVEVKTD
jgi:hypothetical protein